MEFKQALEILKTNQEFKAWKSKHSSHFLINAFVMLEPQEKANNIQLGYSTTSGKKITSFIVSKDNVELFTDEVYKRPEKKLTKLNPEKVKTTFHQAIKIAQHQKQLIYPAEETTKKIIILQNEKGEQWNITFVTKSFNMLNFRIDANSGTLLEHKKTSLLQLGSNLK